MRKIPVVLGLVALASCSGNHNAPAQGVSAPPPSAANAKAELSVSPRHGEWVMVKVSDTDSVRAWLVYPERKEKAPVVVVVSEIFGLSNWIRSVADQLAEDGFIAIAPEFLTRYNIPQTADGEPNPDSARARIREVTQDMAQPEIRAVAEFAMNLPAATKKYGVVGFCWGGGVVFEHAVRYPDVGAVVSYYGTTPAAGYERVKAPVLGLYGENDARVNATIARADTASKANKFTYEPHIFAGAGHGFLRQQEGQNGANLRASEEAWPLTVEWFRRHLR